MKNQNCRAEIQVTCFNVEDCVSFFKITKKNKISVLFEIKTGLSPMGSLPWTGWGAVDGTWGALGPRASSHRTAQLVASPGGIPPL